MCQLVVDGHLWAILSILRLFSLLLHYPLGDQPLHSIFTLKLIADITLLIFTVGFVFHWYGS